MESQGTAHCDNMDELRQGKKVRCKGHKIIDVFTIRRYTDTRGYEEWEGHQIPKEEWSQVQNLNHVFSQKPTYHYENCRYHLFGGILQLLQTVDQI